LLGWLGWGVHGLFASYFLGQAVNLVFNILLLNAIVGRMPVVPRAAAAALFRRHSGFAFYTLPAELIGNFSMQLPVLVLSSMGAAAALGAFSRARQLVAAPLQLMGTSIGQVFRQRAAEEYHATGTCRLIYRQTFLALAAAGFAPTVVLMALAPAIFRIVLGPNWTSAGEMAQLLAPMLYLSFVCGPLASVFYIRGAQQEDLMLSVCGLVLLAALLALGLIWRATPEVIVAAYAIGYALIYAVYMIRAWVHARPDAHMR
jgi:O-antigen/teichoic acid export membrane protein